jgi:hypothetical protein
MIELLGAIRLLITLCVSPFILFEGALQAIHQLNGTLIHVIQLLVDDVPPLVNQTMAQEGPRQQGVLGARGLLTNVQMRIHLLEVVVVVRT